MLAFLGNKPTRSPVRFASSVNVDPVALSPLSPAKICVMGFSAPADKSLFRLCATQCALTTEQQKGEYT